LGIDTGELRHLHKSCIIRHLRQCGKRRKSMQYNGLENPETPVK